jgi:hypothetical protein
VLQGHSIGARLDAPIGEIEQRATDAFGRTNKGAGAAAIAALALTR